jgi:hypothetical protein
MGKGRRGKEIVPEYVFTISTRLGLVVPLVNF